ncbi:hypothetical protein [Dyadobacter pollutisoli]|uniref:Uncharacterized protein n=1 Tax=Dyadobacter pollutisoli TaxID=2910158 RepID=A0A9E8SLE8_9BACT|nr:hypothetical protein [Dyadobacter pollutisoli]WAC13515.1 hypothetical protein ON006_06070 [Dyadobacter pollutisoli]
MEAKNYTGAIPENQQGSRIDVGSKKELASVDEAIGLFEVAGSRLLNVNSWQGLASDSLARFRLFDVYGDPVDGPAREGLLIRIDIPGPGTDVAGGYDWVKIEEISKYESGQVQSLAIRVRPTQAPDSRGVTAHFYSDQSTSTFTVTREQTTVTAAVYDRNIETNKESANVVDRVRNAVTSFAGQKVFSKVQWQSLADGLIG